MRVLKSGRSEKDLLAGIYELGRGDPGCMDGGQSKDVDYAKGFSLFPLWFWVVPRGLLRQVQTCRGNGEFP